MAACCERCRCVPATPPLPTRVLLQGAPAAITLSLNGTNTSATILDDLSTCQNRSAGETISHLKGRPRDPRAVVQSSSNAKRCAYSWKAARAALVVHFMISLLVVRAHVVFIVIPFLRLCPSLRHQLHPARAPGLGDCGQELQRHAAGDHQVRSPAVRFEMRCSMKADGTGYNCSLLLACSNQSPDNTRHDTFPALFISGYAHRSPA